jgi:chlorophyll/bacteriochlorophyll a synthase
MSEGILASESVRAPALRDIVALSKPITWFPPMWAFGCGVISSGASLSQNWIFFAAGLLLTGPLVCGTSQMINDWCDRFVDAINEPDRPIPSGRIAGRWGFGLPWIGAAISLLLAATLGGWVLAATCVALFCGWAYSAPPFRFKRSGWIGPLVCALSYEGLSWFTGASVMLGTLPPASTLLIILLYSLGAHGIMTLNDFKAVRGDAATGLRSLPVTLGVNNAAWLACAIMTVPQIGVIFVLFGLGHMLSAAIITALLIAQIVCMARLLRDPARFAPWYNASGVSLYVLGMLAAALGIGGYL